MRVWKEILYPHFLYLRISLIEDVSTKIKYISVFTNFTQYFLWNILFWSFSHFNSDFSVDITIFPIPMNMYICGENVHNIICTCLNFLNGIIASWSKNEVVIRSLFVFVLTGLFFSFCTSMASCLSNICENCVAVIHKVLEFSSSSSSESAQCSAKKISSKYVQQKFD